MNTRIGMRVASMAAAGVLALTGCGKEPSPPATQPPAPPPTDPVLTLPTVPATQPELPPPTTPDPRPSFPGQPKPMPPGGFVPPDSPTFTPPGTIGGQPLPGTPQPPKPTDPPPPKPTDPPPGPPPNPTDPPTQTPKPEKPPTYPERIGGKTLKEWLKELEYTGGGPVQKDDQVRETAVKVIPGFGPDARKPSVEPLINAVRSDPDPGVQVAAITVVSNMGFDMREQVKPVIAALQQRLANSTSGNIVRMYCVRSLASFGPDAAASIPYFKQACLDPSWETRREIAIALSLVGATPVDGKGMPKKDAGPNEKAIETLMEYQLKDRSLGVRLEAAKSLLALGPPFSKDPLKFAEMTKDARVHIEEVVKFESGKGPKANARGAVPDRSMYVWALLLQLMYDDRKIQENIRELTKLVKEPDGPNADQVRLFAIQALGAAGSIFPVLVEQDRALADKDKVAAKAVAAVTDALQYKHEPALIYTAMNSLALIGKSADAAVPALQKIADEKPKPPPPDSPKGTPPDDSMQRMAKQTIEVLLGRRKYEDYGKEEAKPPEKKDPAEKK